MKRTDPFLKTLRRSLRQCPSLNGREEFVRSAVLALMMKRDDEYHLVFQKRNPSIRQGDEISFPGGRIHDGLDKGVIDTALRETEEEMGISRRQVSVLGRLDFVITPTGNLVDVVVGLAKVSGLSEFTPNTSEVSRIFSVPLTFFRENPPDIYHVQLQALPTITGKDGVPRELFPTRELGLPKRYHTAWKGGRLPILVYRYDGEVIWGITARIVRDLVSRAFSVVADSNSDQTN